MIVSSRATLGIYSETVTAAEVTAALGIEPTRSSERAGSTKRRSHWSLDVAEVDPDDDGGFAAVESLVELLRDRAAALAALRPACEMIIWWSGDSDGTQGGFVMTAALLTDLAALGCELYGTAFLAETDATDDGDDNADDD